MYGLCCSINTSVPQMTPVQSSIGLLDFNLLIIKLACFTLDVVHKLITKLTCFPLDYISKVITKLIFFALDLTCFPYNLK